MTFPESEKEFFVKDDFKCVKCGQCCRPIVKISNEEIEKIESSGKSDFFEWDENIQSNALKREKGVCKFLKRDDDFFVCSIYDVRPATCRAYPFVDGRIKVVDCRPKNWERWMKIEDVVE